jgi:hypothetical protein
MLVLDLCNIVNVRSASVNYKTEIKLLDRSDGTEIPNFYWLTIENVGLKNVAGWGKITNHLL